MYTITFDDIKKDIMSLKGLFNYMYDRVGTSEKEEKMISITKKKRETLIVYSFSVECNYYVSKIEFYINEHMFAHATFKSDNKETFLKDPLYVEEELIRYFIEDVISEKIEFNKIDNFKEIVVLADGRENRFMYDLVVLKDEKGKLYISDSKKDGKSFIIAKVTNTKLKDFIDGNITVNKIFNSNDVYYCENGTYFKRNDKSEYFLYKDKEDELAKILSFTYYDRTNKKHSLLKPNKNKKNIDKFYDSIK